MINLLPSERALHIRYGRSNAKLVRWVIALVAAIAGLLIILSAGSMYISRQSRNLERNIAHSRQQFQSQNLDQVQKDAKEISGDIKVINQVLSREIRFSSLIQDIGKVMPQGTVLGSLTLSKIDGAIDLSANARDYSSAAQIAVNLNDPKNGLFEKIDIININCLSVNVAGANYKCSGTFKALFSKSAQGRFLSVPKGGSQ